MLLQPGELLPPLLSYLLFAESARLAPEHICPLAHAEIHLVADGHQTPGQMLVVLGKKAECDHEIVDIIEDKSVLGRISGLLGKE